LNFSRKEVKMDDDKLLGYQRLLSIIYNKFGKDKFLEVIDELEKCDEKSYQVFLDNQKEASDKLIYSYKICENTDGTRRVVIDRY